MSKKIKPIIFLFIFLLVVLGTSQLVIGERINFDQLPAAIREGILKIIRLVPFFGEKPQAYELLIKKSPTGAGQGAYQSGDIVLIKPAGHEWSAGEINNFWIVRMDLTPSQAEALVQPLEIATGEKDETGQPITQTLARRKYHLNPEILANTEKGQMMSMEAVEER